MTHLNTTTDKSKYNPDDDYIVNDFLSRCWYTSALDGSVGIESDYSYKHLIEIFGRRKNQTAEHIAKLKKGQNTLIRRMLAYLPEAGDYYLHDFFNKKLDEPNPQKHPGQPRDYKGGAVL